jgi:hypothetical protein
MIDPHNRECLINNGLLNATQVMILLGFTETTQGKLYANRIELHTCIYKNTNFCIVNLRELSGLPCIFCHCNAIGNVLSLNIQYN